MHKTEQIMNIHPTEIPPVVWLVRGTLAVTDSALTDALRRLADQAERLRCGVGRSDPVAGVLLDGPVAVAWRAEAIDPERATAMMETPMAAETYRLLTLTLTRQT